MELLQETQKYIGTPWKEHGRDMQTGFDCYGLVWHIHNTILHKNLPDYEYTVDTLAEQSIEIYKHLADAVISVTDTEHLPGDIVLLEYMGEIAHIGIYVGSNYILHTSSSAGACLDQLESNNMGRTLRNRIKGWYRCQ